MRGEAIAASAPVSCLAYVDVSTAHTAFCLSSHAKLRVARVQHLCNSLSVGDIDGNGRLSYAEFAKVLGRMPEFLTKFRVFIN